MIPFYYEVKEGKQWAVEFCKDFYLTFIWQYLAYTMRNRDYLTLTQEERGDFDAVVDIAKQEGLEYLLGSIHGIKKLIAEESVDYLWSSVRDVPHLIANKRSEYVVQMIDEFQYLNSEICRNKGGTQVIKDFAAGYMSTAEYRNAPLLISGSWIGWLRDLLHTMLPSRFRHYTLGMMPEEETVEMIYKYAQMYDIPVTEHAVLFVFSRNGFTKDALAYFQEHGIRL